MQNFDILIVGGGLAGLSLAHALADLPLKIGIIEAVSAQYRDEVAFDARSVALSLASQHIFTNLGLGPALTQQALPIELIHVSDKGHFGMTRLRAAEHQVPAFGYVVDIHSLVKILETSLQQKHPQVTRICPAKVTAIHSSAEITDLQVTTPEGEVSLTAKLVIAADGSNSTIRNLLGIQTQREEHQHSAVIANIGLAQAHHNQAFERFTRSGPLALLPLTDQRMALVWTFPKEQAAQMLTLPEPEFLAALQTQFGYRVGRFTQVGARQLFPLESITALEQIRPGVVIIGNAAHLLHPIAGQGFNLSLRDIAALAQVLKQAVRDQKPLGSLSVLQTYIDSRKTDQKRTMLITQGLTDLFSYHFSPVIKARNLGLTILDIIPPLKRHFTRATMGLAGRVPRLACARKIS